MNALSFPTVTLCQHIHQQPRPRHRQKKNDLCPCFTALRSTLCVITCPRTGPSYSTMHTSEWLVPFLLRSQNVQDSAIDCLVVAFKWRNHRRPRQKARGHPPRWPQQAIRTPFAASTRGRRNQRSHPSASCHCRRTTRSRRRANSPTSTGRA